MLNYIASISAAMAISIWIKSGSGAFGILEQGTFPKILGSSGTLVILIAMILFAGMYVFIVKGKRGYEVSVIGESRNTAKYLGIKVNRTMIVTMLFSGLVFGIIGFLIVCGINRSFSPTIVGGKGFTGVLIAWLGHFQPLQIALFSFLAAMMERGTASAATIVNISSTQFSAICTGVFFFTIITCEFFSSYRIKLRHKAKPALVAETVPATPEEPEESEEEQ